MQNKDLSLIAVIVIISAMASYFLSSAIIGSNQRTTTVESVGPITSEFVNPDARFFNEDAINPTKDITIGTDGNEEPFDEQ